MAKEKVIYAHEDRLGRIVAVGDYVAFADSNLLSIGKVEKITPKMVILAKVPSSHSWDSTYRKYTNQTVLVGGAELTVYLLRNVSS
jgi:hypothetical protein